MQITVPLGGSNVVPEGEGPSRDGSDRPSTLAQRKSLHTVRIAAPTTPEYRPEWKENGQLKWVPQEQVEEPAAAEEQVVESTVPRGNGLPDAAAQSNDALHRDIAELKQAVQLMAQSQFGQPQEPQGPQPPNPEDFDFYEPRQVAEFHKLNNAYIQATVQQSVQAALAPHSNTLQDIELIKQHNRLVNAHGEDANFKQAMDAAIKLVANSNFKFSLPEAYEHMASVLPPSPHQTAAPSQSARPGQRTMTAQEAAQKAAQAQSLPPRNGVSGAGEPGLPSSLMNVGALGRIMLHNQQTGRARPI